MARQFSSKLLNVLTCSKQQRRRAQFRQILLETLQRRELLAVDAAGPVFAPGTSQEYVDEMIAQFGGQDGPQGFNTNPNRRWSNPVGGPSTAAGDPSVVTWSIVPDGTIDTTGGGSVATDLVSFMDRIYGGGTGTVQDRPWFNIFERAYDRWSEVSGLTFVYEPADDGSDIAGGNRGVAGVRGDVRIGGRRIDGNSGILAFNYFPNSGGNGGFDGDMIIDTADSFYVNNEDGPNGENRGLFNVLMHEAGHGIGLGHSIPVNQTKLLEPFVSFAYLGAQHDDILGAQDLYGDTLENNDSLPDSTQFGDLTNGVRNVQGVSIDQEGDDDWYEFTVASSGRISITVAPQGEEYPIGNQGGGVRTYDSRINQDLSFELRNGANQVIATANATSAGQSEELIDFDLPGGGDYRIRVMGAAATGDNDPQLYDMQLQLVGIAPPNDEETPPRLLSVAPNVGQIFSFNRTNLLEVGPNELTFRFDGGQTLDPSSFNGLRVTRTGFDGGFGDANDVILEPAFVGFGESQRIIQMRFAEALPDDLYRIEVFAADTEGMSAVRNSSGEALQPRFAGTDRDTILFDLELGNRVVAVVPQPTSRDDDGNILQARDQIEVYFSAGDLLYPEEISTGEAPNPTVVQPSFYRLIADRGTINNSDDVVFEPISVTYEPGQNKATLTFGSNIDDLDLEHGSFRLRVGTNEEQPSAPDTTKQPGVDPAGTFAGAANLDVFDSLTSLEVSEQIVNASAFPLDFPGAPDTPGVREINDDNPSGNPIETHITADNPDSDTGVSVQLYNFNKVDPIGFDGFGQPIFNVITPDQEQRARDIFELYSSVLGIQFVESEEQGWTIATANLDGIGGELGRADVAGGLVTLDAAENWNDEFGVNDQAGQESWFVTAMGEIGEMLGLAHSSELPPGSVMAGPDLVGENALNSGNPIEPIFPGAVDTLNALYLHRADSRDIDMYRFEIADGSAGEFSAEIVAERAADSSLLDSALTLFRELPGGRRQVIAFNDDYFSEDSFLKVQLEPGVYYLGVSASGNAEYDPEITDSGMGGVTEGSYQLRTTFRPSGATSIVDVDGTAIDGDADGIAGGVFNFWFDAAAPQGENVGQRRSLFVDKTTGSETGDGSRANPFLEIDQAFAAAQPGDIVRIVGDAGADGDLSTGEDNRAFEIGTSGSTNQTLSDGRAMNVPQGVTVMIDAGALFKVGRSIIGVGSSTSSGDRSQASLQVLGTPEQSVWFTSYTDESLGVDTDPFSSTPNPGDWGGIIFRNTLDRAEGRFDDELEGRFTNYVSYASMEYGGGLVSVDGQDIVVAPIQMDSARPTIINNDISKSASAALSADPNSFEESRFVTPQFQEEGLFTPDYDRVGPEIHGNTVTENSTNGLFIRVETAEGQATTPQTVTARWDDTDIVHVIADTLTIEGTTGGPFLETVAPELAIVGLSGAGIVPNGQLVAGQNYLYRMSFVDASGNEGVTSTPTINFQLAAGNNAIQLNDLPSASENYVARRLYRSDDGGASYTLVAELDRSSTIHIDSAAASQTPLTIRNEVRRSRLDANLVIDPGTIVKIDNGRLVAGIGAQIVAEGQAGLPVRFTSRQDDGYGAGGTFDTNADGATDPAPGDWGGIYFGQAGSGSLDYVSVSYGGGQTPLAGTFSGFNAIEIHQSDVRITNSIIEDNASGVGGPASENREGFGFNEPAAIFVRGAQPILVDNVIRRNADAAISIDPMSLSGEAILDQGRLTGFTDRFLEQPDNKGPLITGNALGQNGTNGLVIRGATLTTESVWDDTDIVHVVEDEILVPDLYVFGGLNLLSSADASLVVKFGTDAGLTANGRPLDIDDRIGGSLRVIGTPGFPVILTSLADDSTGAGLDPAGRAQVDTNGDDPEGIGNGAFPQAGDWRSIRIGEFSNDRNVAALTERELATGAELNGDTNNPQRLGSLATGEKASDNNLRLGFTISGTINSIDDVDVYSFQGTAGTQVWFDIDRTKAGLDSVVELIDADGNIIAQSDNSFDESNGTLGIYSDPTLIDPSQVFPMQDNAFAPRNGGGGFDGTFADFYSTNTLDAGMRLILPGAAGSRNTYFVRVRSNNIDSRDPNADRSKLTSSDPVDVAAGRTSGQYQLQIRLRNLDETAGSTVSYADIRYATNGVEVFGNPAHSPLVGEAVEPISNNDIPANALDLGNLLNSDRAALSVAGELSQAGDVDWFRFDINQDSIQGDGLAQQISAIIDVDYADSFGRANTSLWLFYDDRNGLGNGSGLRLVNFGTDSNIADDQGRPTQGGDETELSRGSAGVLDAFIGATSLPSGTYFLAITANDVISGYLAQFYAPDAGGNPLTRVEPINSSVRVAEDRFGGSTTTGADPLQVAFSGNDNRVEFSLADVPLLITQRFSGDTSELITVNSLTGEQTSAVSRFPFIEDAAIRGDGTLHGARSPQGVVINDDNSGGIIEIDTAGNGATVVRTTTSGIDTFELAPNVQPAFTPPVNARQGVGIEFLGLTYPQTGNSQYLLGVGSRGYNQTEFIGGSPLFPQRIDARNYVYRLDPGTLAATSAPFADRQGDARVAGAGTQIVERGYINTARDVRVNERAQTIVFSDATPIDPTIPDLVSGDRVVLVTPDGTQEFNFKSNDALVVTFEADTPPQPPLSPVAPNRPIFSTLPFGPSPTEFFQDGMSFDVSDGANTFTFEFDTGINLVNEFDPLLAGDYDGTLITIIDPSGTTGVWEIDSNGIVGAGNQAIQVDQTTTATDLQIAIEEAINVGPAVGLWSVEANILPSTQVVGGRRLATANLSITGENIAAGGVTVTPSPVTGLSPFATTGDYGVTAGSFAISVEEFHTNITQAPTPGAIVPASDAINAVGGFGVAATVFGDKIELAGATAVDVSNALPVKFIEGGANETVIPFSNTDTGFQLNNRFVAAVQQFEPFAYLAADGSIVLPNRSFFLEDGTNDRNDLVSSNAQLSTPQYGYVTGLGFASDDLTGLGGLASDLYAVSENGDLFVMRDFDPNGRGFQGDFVETLYNPNTRSRIRFSSLTFGPSNVEGGRFADTLFGIDTSGVLYAFDTLGRPEHIFEDGAWFIQTDARFNPSGIAFSNMDVNPWHQSGSRSGDDGHGVNISYDGSRRVQENGGDSLYFGFDGDLPGDWGGINNIAGGFPGYDATRANTYDFAGGARGSVVSDELDLSDYGPADKPYLYFNYYLETENRNADNPNDNTFMRDAFRVFVAGDDGQWKLVATNNSDFDNDRLNGNDEFDLPPFTTDPEEASTRQVSELFDAGANGAPDSWRQARVDLSRFAGESRVRIRFDFSTAGSMSGPQELYVLPAAELRGGQSFTTTEPDPVDPANNPPVNTTFEFDFGVVLQLSSAGAINVGDNFTVEGTVFTFATDNSGNNILVEPGDSAAVLADRIALKLAGMGLSPQIDPMTPSRISVVDATLPAAASPGLPAAFISDQPGVAAGNIALLVHPGMSSDEVREVIRIAMANEFNEEGQKDNVDTIRFNDNSIFFWGDRTVLDAGPLLLTSSLEGDEFGEPTSGSPPEPSPPNRIPTGRGAQRGQNNRFEGVYVDDIIIGFAERGEMVTYENNATATVTNFIDNPLYEPPGITEIETGTYQIEIRRGPTFGSDAGNFPSLIPTTAFDTNDRHTNQVSLIAPAGAELADGQTFDLSDGIRTVTFEFDDTSIVSGPNQGVAQGNVRIPFSPLGSDVEVAVAIKDAINSPQAQASLDLLAGLSDGTAEGNESIGKTTGSNVVHLHGNASATSSGSFAFDGDYSGSIAGNPDAGFVLYGAIDEGGIPTDVHRSSSLGDANRHRDQGQVIVHSNIIRDTAEFGIMVDAGARVSSLVPLAGALPHPGSPRNLVQLNDAQLVPGPVLVNNLIYANATGGILFSGDSRSNNTAQAPVPFGRIVNNTIVGEGGGTGITVSDNASPTLLNNIVADLQVGIDVDGTSSTTVVGGTTYQGNVTNTIGTGLGNNAQVLGTNDPLFVDAANRNFYLEEGSQAIDSSVNVLNDRTQMTLVRTPLGIAVSPILAPELDLTGVQRVDDPTISNPSGTGANPFKDRGAFDKADFFGPVAQITQPIDNDAEFVDRDRTVTYLQLDESVGALEFFSILLFEAEGTGPDQDTVTSDAIALTENGRLLREGVDYTFGYIPGSRLIRLTPLAGIWRNDSVYEITLNNRERFRALTPDPSQLAEGSSFDIGTLTFEFDMDGSVASGNIAIPFQPDFSLYELSVSMAQVIDDQGGLSAYVEGDGRVMIAGATSVTALATTVVGPITDVADNNLRPNRSNGLTQFTIVMPEVEMDFGDAPAPGHLTELRDRGNIVVDGSRHAILPSDAPKLTLGTHVDGEVDGQPSIAGTGDDIAFAEIVASISEVQIEIAGPAVFETKDAIPEFDGQLITITDPTFQIATFEFDTAADPGDLSSPDNIRVAIELTDTADMIAVKLRDAVNKAVLDGHIEGLNAFAAGNQVDLGGTENHVFVFPEADPATDVVTRVAQSDFIMTLPDDFSLYAEGDTFEITGTSGRTTVFELRGSGAGTLASNVVVPVDFMNGTPQDIADALAAAINTEVNARRLSLAPVELNGLTFRISGDDEDGVTFNGLFNSRSRAVPLTVETTGSGILEVWVDWNGDGDFLDAEERIQKFDLDLNGKDDDEGEDVDALLMRNGINVFGIKTPGFAEQTAADFQAANPGQRFFVASRFRLSTTGSDSLGGTGIGGEVEDYMVEIVVGAPPVANDDYYRVLEDEVLVVPALGILANDTDEDHDVTELRVNDEDKSTPEIDLLRDVDPTFGDVTVNADGSFTFTPAEDFFGQVEFVYNVTDPRLVSEVPATVTIDVLPVNDAPVAFDDVITIFEDETISRDGDVFTANDLKGKAPTASVNELPQDLTVIDAVIRHPSGADVGTVSVTNNVLTYTPPAHYNSEIDGPALIELTIQDNGQSFLDPQDMNPTDDFKTDTSTLTINIVALNDSPEYEMPAETAVDEDAGPQTVDPFITGILPGPDVADDEDEGPADNFESQDVSFSVVAQNPELFASGPAIDDNGVLTYELNPDVTNVSPFPNDILVEVTAIDTGAGETVMINGYDPAQVAAGTATYDGATITITDTEGNVVVFEFDDVNFAGVGSTAGVPHVAVPFNPATDTQASVSSALAALISDPPAASINSGGAGGWAVVAFVDSVTDELRLVGEASVASTDGVAAAPIVALANPLAIRPASNAVTRTFTIVPTAINDAPEFDLPVNPISVDEDEGSLTFIDFLVNARPGPLTALDELANQSLTLSVEAAVPASFDEQPEIVFDEAAGTATLTFRTAEHRNRDTFDNFDIIITLMDDGGVNHPLDVDTTIKTLSLDVAPINDAPSFSLPTPEISVFEDNEQETGVDPTVFVGFAANPTQGPDRAEDETTNAGTRQDLEFVIISVSDPTLFETQPAISPAGDLSFKTAADQNGTAVVVVRLLDDGVGPETGNGDDNQARPDQTFTITVEDVNDKPDFDLPPVLDVIEDQGLVQVPNFVTNFVTGPATATDEIPQELVVFAEAVDPDAFAVQPTIGADGRLIFQIKPHLNRLNANLDVRVWLTDDGLTPADEPGVPHDNMSDIKTFTINAAPINDAPDFDLSTTQVTVIEDVEDFEGIPFFSRADFATNITVGPDAASDERESPPQNVMFEVVNVSAPELFETLPAISSDGELTFKTADHRNGSALVVVRVVDDGAAAPAPNDNNSELKTFTITVTPVNDAPEFTISSGVTVDEDAGLISIDAFATGVRRGPIGTDDENGQIINFEVTADNPALFEIQPAISPSGTLTFQTAEHVNSLNADSLGVTVKLVDDGVSTPPPNQNESVEQSFVITVNPVNDEPIADAFSRTIQEDESVTITAAEVLVGDVPGPTPDEDSQSIRMTLVASRSAMGGTVEAVLAGTEVVSFTYTPPADLVGEDTIPYLVTDDGTPSRSGNGIITIVMDPVNDAPVFTKGNDITVFEDIGDVSLSGWATNVAAGPVSAVDELDTQMVTFEVSSADPSLFAVEPTVASDGTLAFTPAKDANGSTVVTVVAVDDGPSDAPNVNRSEPQTFTLTLTPANDAPVFTGSGDVTVAEDSGAYADIWATDIAPAAGLLDTPQTALDEQGQIVDFAVSVDQPDLFSVQPTISNSGQLLFTPAQNAVGSAVLVVTAIDRGPSGAQDENTSAPQTFTVNITPVNDAPVAVLDNYTTDEDAVLQIPAAGVLANDTDVDLPNDTLTAIPGSFESTLGAQVVLNSDGSFSYDPRDVLAVQQLVNGQLVLDTFTYSITDAAGVESSPATVSINVNGLDDAPIANDDSYSIGVNQSRLLDVLINDTDIDSPIDPRTIEISAIPVFGTAIVNQTGVIEYTASPGFRGSDSLTYTVRDTSGNISNEATVNIVVNNAPVASNDSVFTFKDESIDIDVLANDSDLDGEIDPQTVQVVAGPTPSGTTTVLSDGKVRFTPAAGFAGQVSFSYVVADDLGTISNVADVQVRVQNSRWQNPTNSLDVNADGIVSPIDALILINYINSDAPQELPSAGVTPPPFLDPNGDELVTATDVLQVINFLNDSSAGGGGLAEGEASESLEGFNFANYAMMVTVEDMLRTVGPQVVAETEEALMAAALEAGFIGPVNPDMDDEDVDIGMLAFTSELEAEAEELPLTCSADFEQHEFDSAIDSAMDELYGPRLDS